jgi:Asp-tRNA(Asn)/Glu-tRNA(Gln) amidotransferase A subunit family amidase
MQNDGAPASKTLVEPPPPEEPGFLPGEMDRRSFLVRTGGAAAVAGTAAALGPVAGALAAPSAPAQRSSTSSPLPSASAVLADGRDLVDHEVMELAALLQGGEVSSVELTEAFYERINAFNGPFETYGDNGLYNAFVRIDEGIGLTAARLADERLSAGRREGLAVPYLCGIPMGFKDSIATQGFAAQDGTVAFLGNVAEEDATSVGRLRTDGVVPLGITIASAFSGTIAGTFSGNAWNTEYIPGGSSQGSGVATAARLAAACLGEETGGSIIFPSACNGDSAIKVSQGLVSIAGLMPLSPGYDTIGPIARSGRDAALILNALIGAGPDPFGDPQTLAVPRDYPALGLTPRLGSRPLQGLTIGINKTDWLTTPAGTQQHVDPQSLYGAAHLAAFERLCGELRSMGASVIEFNGVDFLEFGENANPYYNSPDVLEEVEGSAISPSAAVLNPNRYDIYYSEAVKAFAETRPPAQEEELLKSYGARLTSAEPYSWELAIKRQAGVSEGARREGERRRRKWASNYKGAFDAAGVDFMVVLSVGDTPPLRSVQTYACRRNNQLANSLSFPMVSFPIGFDGVGLPISAQFKGPRFSEPQLVQAMIDYQSRHPEWHTKRPGDPVPKSTARRLSKTESLRLDTEDLSLSQDPLVSEENFR